MNAANLPSTPLLTPSEAEDLIAEASSLPTETWSRIAHVLRKVAQTEEEPLTPNIGDVTTIVRAWAAWCKTDRIIYAAFDAGWNAAKSVTESAPNREEAAKMTNLPQDDFEAWYLASFSPRARMRAETKDREPFGETFFKGDLEAAYIAGRDFEIAKVQAQPQDEGESFDRNGSHAAGSCSCRRYGAVSCNSCKPGYREEAGMVGLGIVVAPDTSKPCEMAYCSTCGSSHLHNVPAVVQDTASPGALCVRMFAGSRPEGTDPDYVCALPALDRIHHAESNQLGRHEYIPPCASSEACTQNLYHRCAERQIVQAKSRIEITDDMVARAQRAYFGEPPANISSPRRWMHAALEAALNG